MSIYRMFELLNSFTEHSEFQRFHRAMLVIVFNACSKSQTAFAGSTCQRLALLDEIAGTLNAYLLEKNNSNAN